MGGSENQVNLITDSGVTPWPRLSKVETGQKLAQAIADHFQTLGAK
jgi:hypothetical protein